MIELTYMPCAVEHLKLIQPVKGLEHEQAVFLSPQYEHIFKNNFSMSAWAGNKCVCAAGICPIYSHKAIAWALMSKDAGPYMRQITAKVKSFLAMDKTPRIEMLVAADFKAGNKWAKLLGMTQEGPARRMHGPNGEDEIMYVRIKE